MFPRRLSAFLALVPLSAAASAQLAEATPPMAVKKPFDRVLHGDTFTDNYFWIREKTNPEVISHLKAENAYTEAVMKPTVALQDKLFKETVARIKEDDSDVPTFDRGYWYYTRTVKGKEYPLYCRRKGSMKAKEQVILDGNVLAKGKKFFSVGDFEVSPNGRLLAYSTDTTGYREYQLAFKDLTTGKTLSDKPGKAVQFQWAADSKTFFTVTEDASKRWNALYRHQIGSQAKKLVVEEKDAQYYLSVGETSDRERMVIDRGSKDTNEQWILSLKAPQSAPVLISKRGGTRKVSIDSQNGWFYMITNDKGPNNRLLKAKAGSGALKWSEVLPYRSNVVLSGADLFKNFMVLTTREGGFRRLSIMKYGAQTAKKVPMADPVATIGLAGNPDRSLKSFRYTYTSLTTPATTYQMNPVTGARKTLKTTQVLGGFKSKDYVSELMWATAKDGTKIPISLVRKKTTAKSAKTPLMLTAYGSYGAPSDPYFSVSRLNLLNRGVIFATAHIRGGGEFGEAWYKAGKMEKKMNTFTDFIACADHLVEKKVSSHQQMAMSGGSAGGLLMGAVLNLRPDLVKMAIADVPFVDVINTMLDETIPLTTAEFTEWGNPKKEKEYRWMMEYSPYDNVGAKNYPHILCLTGLNDSQVPYWEGTKWVARLRELKAGNNKVLLKVNMDAGHGGASGRYSSLKEVMFEQAFLLTLWGKK